MRGREVKSMGLKNQVVLIPGRDEWRCRGDLGRGGAMFTEFTPQQLRFGK